MEMVRVTNHDDGTTLIAIDRPARKNAICAVTAIELQQAFAEFDCSATQRVAVITGSDEAFSSGADVSNIPELWRCIPTVGITTEKPVIAAVGGWCVGGALVLAMMCDLLVAADNAKFSYPEAKLGFTGGLISALPTRIPHKIAMELIMLCNTIDAKRAYEVGFANRVVPAGQQVDAALGMAREIATFAPLVLKTLKRFVTQEVMPQGPSERMAKAAAALAAVRDSEDGREGALAFREKRAPAWKGR
jgi:enoyl-CoA hydratase/carnithine racemase